MSIVNLHMAISVGPISCTPMHDEDLSYRHMTVFMLDSVLLTNHQALSNGCLGVSKKCNLM